MALLLFSFPASAAAPIEQTFDIGPQIALKAPVRPVAKSLEASGTYVSLARQIAAKHGLKTDDFIAVIECESHFDSNAIGDHGHSFGLAQIHLPSHPEVSKEEAMDPEFAIEWMADRWDEGQESQWTCWRTQHR